MSRNQPATPRRKRQAREMAPRPRSSALVDAGRFATLLALLAAFGGQLTHLLVGFVRDSAHQALVPPDPIGVLEAASDRGLLFIAPTLALIWGTGLALHWLGGFSLRWPRPRARRSPLPQRAAARAFVGLPGLTVFAGGAFAASSHRLAPVVRLPRSTVAEGAVAAGTILLDLLAQLAALWLLLALAHLLWQHLAHRRALKMSRPEIREEQRRHEIPTEIRAALRRRHPRKRNTPRADVPR